MMRIRYLLATMALLGGLSPEARAQNVPAVMPDAEPVLADTLNSYIRPSYDALASGFEVLEKATAELCETPSDVALSEARSAYGKSTLTWSRIEWFRTGPAMANNRLERILFYPDRKSTGLKQVQRALGREDVEVVSPDLLASKSVAMQGLGAYEFLVFGKGSGALATDQAPFRCAFADSVASNLITIAGELQQGWEEGTPAATLFVKPATDNPLFRDDTEALNLVLGTMVHGLEAIRDIRIGSFLREPGMDRPKSAVYRRSGLTMDSIAAGLQGLEDLFNASGIEQVLPEQDRDLADQVRFEFDQSIRTAQSLDGPLQDLLADETSRKRLAYLKLSIRFIIQRLNNEIAPAAGLVAGFSFGDGD
ncbi:imelysin family protein [Hoeflea sp.]|uniref:imelysin family protein n=1 Tax=Hoeflea sp. TaxID=1940281 RepID=UPI003747D625